METYIIGICDRLHDIIPIISAINTLIFISFAIAYFGSKDNIDMKLATQSDYRVNKISRIGLVCCLVIYIVSLLLFIFVPTAEEIRLMLIN